MFVINSVKLLTFLISRGIMFHTFALREECPNTELFLVRIFLYSVRIQDNTDQKNSVFEHISRSVGARYLNDFKL